MSAQIVVVVLMVVAFVALKLSMGFRSPAQLRAIRSALDEGARLVDVRTQGEFAGGHLKGAVNVPVDRVGNEPRKVGRVDQAIVLYCASGMRSAAAARTLRAKGYTRVLDLGPMANGRRIDA